MSLSLFGVVVFLPPLARFRSRRWANLTVSPLAAAGFYFFWFWSMNRFGHRYAPRLLQLEQGGPR